ncbi:hypothetical protein [Hydrogenophaga sp.]|uniref:hypothetical protein n=1 Tax=Hydrogenophaga sp. TaxID=1904254 RepID=UPI00262E910E|nr:hypothetical protein [Hydrogenophaga sp.]
MKTAAALLSLFLLVNAHANDVVQEPATAAPNIELTPKENDSPSEVVQRRRWEQPTRRARTALPTCGLCGAGVSGYLPCGPLSTAWPPQ